jgi:hypothetical protein
MDHTKIYQRFLNLCSAIDKLGEFPALEPYERCLLNKINEYWVKDEPVSVLQVLDINQRQSRTTTHKYLKSLHSKGYVDLIIHQQDNRFKYIQPSAMTCNYFNTLGKVLLETAATI